MGLDQETLHFADSSGNEIRSYEVSNYNSIVIQVIYQQLVLRISSQAPNTEKLMKARHRKRSAFIVSRCLEPLMKYEARVVDITSQKKVEWRALNSANESLFFTRKYENPVSMSLSGNCFERSTVRITCLQGAANESHLPLSSH